MKKGIDYIGVGVAGIIIKDGKILMLKRSLKTKTQQGKWEIPGGALEWGETFEKALKREIAEEVGIEIEIIEQFGLWDDILDSENQHWVALTYICKVKNGTPKILEPNKADEIGWFTLSGANKLDLSYITRNDIDKLNKRFPKGLPDKI